MHGPRPCPGRTPSRSLPNAQDSALDADKGVDWAIDEWGGSQPGVRWGPVTNGPGDFLLHSPGGGQRSGEERLVTRCLVKKGCS